MKHTKERCQRFCGASECFTENQARCIRDMLIGRLYPIQGIMEIVSNLNHDPELSILLSLIGNDVNELVNWAVCLGQQRHEVCDQEKASL